MPIFYGGSVGGGGGAGITDVTYEELISAISESALIKGTYYRITDFATRHYLVTEDEQVGDVTGSVEPLLVLALSENKLSAVAYSENYPQDIIYYSWNSGRWLGDSSFSDISTGAIISDFKGVILSRFDSDDKVFMPFDYRNVKVRRYVLDPPEWNSGTAYSARDYVKVTEYGSYYIFVCVKDNTNKNPKLETDYWIELFNRFATKYLSPVPWAFAGCPVNALSYQDYYTFGGTVNNFRLNGSGSNPYLPNVYFYGGCSYSSIGSVINSTFGAIIGSTYGTSVNGNIIISTGNSKIGDQCTWNFIKRITGCQIGNNLYTNYGNELRDSIIGSGMMGNTFGDIASCNIGNDFYSNLLGGKFQFNNIGNRFGSNIINSYFQYNRVEEYAINNLDLSSASHVYGAYNCQISKRLDATPKLSYISNGDVLTIVDVTA